MMVALAEPPSRRINLVLPNLECTESRTIKSLRK